MGIGFGAVASLIVAVRMHRHISVSVHLCRYSSPNRYFGRGAVGYTTGVGQRPMESFNDRFANSPTAKSFGGDLIYIGENTK